eukprot:85539_1
MGSRISKATTNEVRRKYPKQLPSVKITENVKTPERFREEMTQHDDYLRGVAEQMKGFEVKETKTDLPVSPKFIPRGSMGGLPRHPIDPMTNKPLPKIIGETLKRPKPKMRIRPLYQEEDECPGFLTTKQLRRIFRGRVEKPDDWTANRIAEKFEVDQNIVDSLLKYADVPRVRMNERGKVVVVDQKPMENESIVMMGPDIVNKLRRSD